jgi:hypothetical protein
VSAQRSLDAWRIATRGLLDMAMHLSRHAIFHRQRHACYLCAQAFAHRALEFHGGHPDAPSRDHVFPRGRGGLAEANILLAHKRCNQRKGDRWPHPCEVIYLAAIYAAPEQPYFLKPKRRRK